MNLLTFSNKWIDGATQNHDKFCDFFGMALPLRRFAQPPFLPFSWLGADL
jgi:hypothetical protein